MQEELTKMDQEFEDSREEKLHNEDEHHHQHQHQEHQNQEQGHEHLFGRQKPVHSALGGGKRIFSSLESLRSI